MVIMVAAHRPIFQRRRKARELDSKWFIGKLSTTNGFQDELFKDGVFGVETYFLVLGELCEELKMNKKKL